VWQTTDQWERRVVLTEEAWRHILRTHWYLGLEPEAILDVVAAPDRRLPGREPGEEWCYREGIGPSSWVKVAVHYDDDVGRIVTAFPRRRWP
jgi:hypothetical protein